jgi:predicted glycoside hydrolase/deacetylase ChbG (UPF0249 family)
VKGLFSVIRLMISCDDCGLSPGIDQAMIDLHRNGMATTASIISNFPHVHTAFEMYSAYPEIELGAHLNLSDGKPLTEIAKRSELVRRSGLFHDRFILFALAAFPSDRLLAIMREELTAQMEVFTSAGIRPAHITTHCHFHVFPAMRKIVHDLAAQYQVQWVRNSDFRLSLVPYNPVFSRKNSLRLRQNVAVPDYIVALQKWLDHPPAQMLNDILKLNGWVELVVHPCLPEDPSYPSDVIYAPSQRYREVQYLQSFFDVLQPYLGGEVELVQAHPQGRHLSHA